MYKKSNKQFTYNQNNQIKKAPNNTAIIPKSNNINNNNNNEMEKLEENSSNEMHNQNQDTTSLNDQSVIMSSQQHTMHPQAGIPYVNYYPYIPTNGAYPTTLDLNPANNWAHAMGATAVTMADTMPVYINPNSYSPAEIAPYDQYNFGYTPTMSYAYPNPTLDYSHNSQVITNNGVWINKNTTMTVSPGVPTHQINNSNDTISISSATSNTSLNNSKWNPEYNIQNNNENVNSVNFQSFDNNQINFNQYQTYSPKQNNHIKNQYYNNYTNHHVSGNFYINSYNSSKVENNFNQLNQNYNKNQSRFLNKNYNKFQKYKLKHNNNYNNIHNNNENMNNDNILMSYANKFDQLRIDANSFNDNFDNINIIVEKSEHNNFTKSESKKWTKIVDNHNPNTSNTSNSKSNAQTDSFLNNQKTMEQKKLNDYAKYILNEDDSFKKSKNFYKCNTNNNNNNNNNNRYNKNNRKNQFNEIKDNQKEQNVQEFSLNNEAFPPINYQGNETEENKSNNMNTVKSNSKDNVNNLTQNKKYELENSDVTNYQLKSYNRDFKNYSNTKTSQYDDDFHYYKRHQPSKLNISSFMSALDRKIFVEKQNNDNNNNKLDCTSSNEEKNKNDNTEEFLEIKPKDIEVNNFNPADFNILPQEAKFYVIKSYSEDDVYTSINYNIWCSTEDGNSKLDSAFLKADNKYPIYLFFSVNASGHFCGMAEMKSRVDFNHKTGLWSQDKWRGYFKVNWIYVKDVPNASLRHIRLENNENRPVTNSRDTQEIFYDKGLEVLKIFHTYKHASSIFDDFEHYEKKNENVKSESNNLKFDENKNENSSLAISSPYSVTSTYSTNLKSV